MTASVGIMVGSFRETVWLWMNNQLKADFYLRPAAHTGADRHPTMAAIADASNSSRCCCRGPLSLLCDLLRGSAGDLGRRRDKEGESHGSIRFLPGENRDAIFAKLPTGDYAVVSEPFANKHDVQVGTDIQLSLGSGKQTFQVLGIYYDYSTERGFVVLDRHTLLKYLPDPAVSNIAVFLRPGADKPCGIALMK